MPNIGRRGFLRSLLATLIALPCRPPRRRRASAVVSPPATPEPPARIHARITAGTRGGPYAFHQIVPGPGGGWHRGAITDDGGAFPAYEANGAGTEPPFNTVMWWRGGGWVFLAGSC